MAKAKVKILNECDHKFDSEWRLCFQNCVYNYDDGSTQIGYRFIWRRPNGTLQAARGQARIPSISLMLKLVSQAMSEGWGTTNGEYAGYEFPEEDDMK